MSSPRSARSWFWLYRPTAPSVRAQAIQVVHMAHAMACRGHHVVLAVDPPNGGRVSADDVLAFYGLRPMYNLELVVLPAGRTLASVAWRARFLRFVAETGGEGVVYARSKRHAREALHTVGKRFRLVVEAHEVDSLLATERGEDPVPMRVLEAEVLAAADGVVTNSPGTLELLRSVHSLPPAIVAQNATHASRVRHPTGPGVGIGYAGSARAYKDTDLLVGAAEKLGLPLNMLGVDEIVPHGDVPNRLATFRVLVLPLAAGLFGEQLTSPLKLWDYLASGVPIVGADVPSLHAAAPGAFEPYAPGDGDALAAAIRRVYDDEDLRARLLSAAHVRTWGDRAAEIDAFVSGLA